MEKETSAREKVRKGRTEQAREAGEEVRVTEKRVWMKRKKPLPRVKRMWMQKVRKAKTRLENGREVGVRESRQADGLQRPGADSTMLWLVEQISELTDKHQTSQNAQAKESDKRGVGLVEWDDWINWEASKQGEPPRRLGKLPVGLEGNGGAGQALEWLG